MLVNSFQHTVEKLKTCRYVLYSAPDTHRLLSVAIIGFSHRKERKKEKEKVSKSCQNMV